MSVLENLTSIRIVCVDHYMKAPIVNLDSCYSEFRGAEVKQVPVLRMFGSTSVGTHICVHIHGVFPYFYIPYDGVATDSLSIERFIYQIATGLDKAINISQGNANSTNQHIFKVSLVKGIPIYGYHEKEHQFLKIFLYNPYFVRKATSLLMNGAVLSRPFQTYESHVPYILQFFIDYNLYGMSFLHVHNDSLYERKDGGKIPKISTSEMEVDILAIEILNRAFMEQEKKSEYANPGIASIWNDEKERRKLLNLALSESVSISQDRRDECITESDRFYRSILKSKIDSNEAEKIQNSGGSNKVSSTYPAECGISDNILDASCVQDHKNFSSNTTVLLPDCFENCDTSIDEEIILSLSQKYDTTLVEEDEDLLEIMRQLEENEENNIEDDSLLAPLTQESQQKLSTNILMLSQTASKGNTTLNGIENDFINLKVADNEDQVDGEFDSDDEFLLDYTLKLDSEVHLSESNNIPQLDGAANDVVPKRKKHKTNGISRIKSFPTKAKCEPKLRNFNIVLNKLEVAETLKLPSVKQTPSNSESTNKHFRSHSSSRKPSKTNAEVKTIANGVNSSSMLHNREETLEETKETILETGIKSEALITPTNTKSKKHMLTLSNCGRRIFEEPIYNNKENSEHKQMQITDQITPKNVGKTNRFCTKSETIEKPKTGKQKPGAFELRALKLDSVPQLSKSVMKRINSRDKYRISREYDIKNNIFPKPGPSRILERKSVKSVQLSEKCTKNASNNFPKVQLVNMDSTSKKHLNIKRNLFKSIDIEDNSSLDSDCMEVDMVGKKSNKVPGADSEIIALESPESDPIAQQILASDLEDDVVLFECSPQSNDSMTKSKNDVSVNSNPAEITLSQKYPDIGFLPENDCDFELKVDEAEQEGDETKENEEKVVDLETEEEEEYDSSSVESFYDRTAVFETTLISSDDSMSDYKFSINEYKKVICCVDVPPPTHNDVLKCLEQFEIPLLVNREPFYSNSKDVTTRKEVGHTVLYIGGASLNDLDERISVIGVTNALHKWRMEKITDIYAEDVDLLLFPANNEVTRSKSDNLREILSSEKGIVICPSEKPPSKHEARVWIKACRKPSSPVGNLEQDSPIQISFETTIMCENTPNFDKTAARTESIQNLSAFSNEFSNSAPANVHHQSLVSKIMSSNSSIDKRSSSPSKLILLSYSKRRKLRRSHRIKQNSLNESMEIEDSNESSKFSSLSSLNNDPTSKSMISNSKCPQPQTSPKSSQRLKEKIAFQDCIVIEDSTDSSESITQNSLKSDSTSDSTIINSMEVKSARKKLFDELSNSSHNLSSSMINNSYGFKVNFENLQTAKATTEHNFLTILSVEIHVQTRGELKPNPEIDPISALFYTIHSDVPEDHVKFSTVSGIIINEQQNNPSGNMEFHKYNKSYHEADVVIVKSEKELYEKFLLLISLWDPDIFAGYEIEMGSWGYIIQRGYSLDMNLMKMLSRIPQVEKVQITEDDEQDLLEMSDYSAGLKLPGRILLDIWRLMRHEIAITSYTFENVVYHILHRRCPLHSHKHLTRLWNKTYTKWIVIEYYLERVNGNLDLLQQLDLIGRTCELAKLFGIQFYEVLSRGSQYRVESMMLRIAKPRNFVSISPSIQQRAHMKAPEYLPLILEPSSRFYSDPMIVLDFQSLYPSIIIAYNYCFSTCLGRVEHLGQEEPFDFGASQLKISLALLKKLVKLDLVTVSPCGAVFVKSSVREGILPRMLNEILSTRLMVKQSMKLHKTNSVLQRVLHSRQLGLKLIANVTYGYTAANFSGRMPCVEIGDSVVSKGRETLERAIKMVESNKSWGAKVVYGDTDSLFVLCPGRSKADAFKIGEEISEAVTEENPQPVKLKLEKVYQPCILQTKKRYVGHMFETADQEKPVYEAKGIETVRRDGCPIVAKMLEKVIRILFETKDVSKAKEYICRQFTKILNGRVNLQDFIYAKEFRGTSGYKPGACVPALELTRKWKMLDPRHEPRRGERVPYVITHGPPLVPLIRLIRSPHELLADAALKINATYYITKAIIPPLNRCLLLIGADVNQWYNDLPRKVLLLHNTAGISLARELQLPKKSTISQYFSTTSCVTDCGSQTTDGICAECKENPQQTVVFISDKINKLGRKLQLTERMCQSCCQRTYETSCMSLDCPVLFLLDNKNREHQQVQFYRELLVTHF